MEFKKRHLITDSGMQDLLCILEAFLPDKHTLAPTYYRLQKWVRKPVAEDLDQRTLFTAHMCRNHDCDHRYSRYPGRLEDKCPLCSWRRFRYASHP